MKGLILAVALVCAPPSLAIANPDNPILAIEQEWDRARYQIADEDARIVALRRLGARIETLATERPDDPAPVVWRAVVLAGEADETGGLGALPLAQQARRLLETAYGLHPPAELRVTLQTTLGALYYLVPPAPIGFGDRRAAETHLREALSADPNGLEANFYYGDFLLTQNRNGEAAAMLRRALQAPPRPGRATGDAGLKRDAENRLSFAERRLVRR